MVRWLTLMLLSLCIAGCGSNESGDSSDGGTVVGETGGGGSIGSGGTGATASGGAAVTGSGGTGITGVQTTNRISVGHAHACVVTSARTIECWGIQPNSGDVPDDDGWDAVWSDDDSICALKVDGSLRCWGEIGVVTPDGTYVDVDLNGAVFICAVRASDGFVDCWDDGGTLPPTAPDEPLTSIACGYEHCCGARASDGQIVCWGAVPEEVPLPANLTESAVLESAGLATCSLSNTGTVTCWGLEACVDGASAGQFVDLSVGDCASCAVDPAGEVSCWGSSYIGSTSPPAGPFIEVSNSADYGCGIKPDGGVECWGGLDAPEGLVALTG